jgi:hypothetical protein
MLILQPFVLLPLWLFSFVQEKKKMQIAKSKVIRLIVELIIYFVLKVVPLEKRRRLGKGVKKIKFIYTQPLHKTGGIVKKPVRPGC